MATARRSTARRTTTRGTAKTGTKRAPREVKPKTLKVEKRDIVIQPIQYAVMDNYVMPSEKVPKGVKLPSNGYGSDGSNRRYEINGAKVFRVGDDLALIQFPCGDYIFVNLDAMAELFQTVKTLDVTKAPPSVNED
jgi:hypothetical protein